MAINREETIGDIYDRWDGIEHSIKTLRCRLQDIERFVDTREAKEQEMMVVSEFIKELDILYNDNSK